MSELNFDFEYWSKLAETDPEGYAESAKAYVHTWIEETYPDDIERQNKLKGLYWKAQNDPEIRKIKDPLVRADRANTKMWIALRKLNALIGGNTNE